MQQSRELALAVALEMAKLADYPNTDDVIHNAQKIYLWLTDSMAPAESPVA